MRLSRSVTLTLLSATIVSASNLVTQTVEDDSWPWPWPSRPRTTTIVDLLSSNPEFGPLIKALQRTALIPILNSSENNMTLVGPITDAMDSFKGDITRELMLYHVLNSTILSEKMEDDEIVVESLLKMDTKNETSLGVGVKIRREGDRGRGQGKLLIGERARSVKSDWEANNGVIQVVDSLLKIPDSIENILEDTPDVSIIHSLLQGVDFPRTYSMFAAANTAFDVLHPMELSYLQTRFAQQDREKLLWRHTTKEILYSPHLKKGGNTTSIEGETIRYGYVDDEILIDSANVTVQNVVARNGVIHIISNLTLPDSVVFTPLKYLYGMHNTIFGETLAASGSANLTHDLSIRQTIFAPINKAYSESIGTQEVLDEVRYNFINEPLDITDLKHNDLLTTKYTLNSLNGNPQKVKFTRKGEKFFLNNQVEILLDPGIPLTYTANAVHAGNTIIYNLATKLSPPGPLRPTTSEGLSLFRSFHHLVYTGLDQRVIFDENAITALLPSDKAWSAMGLAERYLLSEEAKEDLKKVLLECVLEGVYYSNDFSEESRRIKTLSGETISLRGVEGDLVFEDKDLKVHMAERDILAANGVGHSISAVPLPKSVVITPENLINATGFKGWLNILHEYDLSSYLDINSHHTLLIPTDEAIRSASLDTLKQEILASLIDYHIIPPIDGHPPPNLLTETPSKVTTLSGKSLKIKQIYPSVWTIQTNSSTVAARVLDQGKTSHGTQILLIDAVLFEPIASAGGWARAIAVVIFGVAVVVIIAAGVGFVVRWVQRRKETKPLFADEEREPFLDEES